MSLIAATHAENNKLDRTIPLLIAAVVPYYLVCIVFILCALPFILLLLPIEHLLKDEPKAHGDAVVTLMALSVTSAIAVPIIIMKSYLM